MPTIQTYIKQEDFDSYIAIHQKGKGAWTEFIHNALNHKLNLVAAELNKPIKTSKEGLQAVAPELTEPTPVVAENRQIANPVIKSPKDAEKGIDILKQGKGGRYNGDSPIVEPISKSYSARKKK